MTVTTGLYEASSEQHRREQHQEQDSHDRKRIARLRSPRCAISPRQIYTIFAATILA
jgi:hypothetical protein